MAEALKPFVPESTATMASHHPSGMARAASQPPAKPSPPNVAPSYGPPPPQAICVQPPAAPTFTNAPAALAPRAPQRSLKRELATAGVLLVIVAGLLWKRCGSFAFLPFTK